MNLMSKLVLSATFAIAITCLMAGNVSAQETSTETTPTPVQVEPANKTMTEQAKDTLESVQKNAEETYNKVNTSQEAKEISAGILQPIYKLAETMAFSWFHWLAFALMVSGVVSYALQLVLGKLVVLTRAGFDLAEILMDAQGLLLSLVGLVLTTQAAAQNSTFTQSPAAVLSSAGVGALVGFIFYLWGQSKELQALRGRRVRGE